MTLPVIPQAPGAIAEAGFQLPLWQDTVRGMPYAFARSALFSVGNRVSTNDRPYLKQARVTSLSGLEVTYTGEELRQDDADVLLQCYHLARLQPLGAPIEFTAYSMAKALKWSTTESSYQRLKSVIIRLKATAVLVTGNLGGYGGSLIQDFVWMDEVNGMPLKTWRILLNPKLIALFSQASYVLTDWIRHVKLGQLAKWLHHFYGSHREPFPMKVETLKDLSGSKTKTLFHFRQEMKRALAELAEYIPTMRWKIDAKDRVMVSFGSADVLPGMAT